jgi:hypothetical protein
MPVLSVFCLEEPLPQSLVPLECFGVCGSICTVWLHHLDVRSYQKLL